MTQYTSVKVSADFQHAKFEIGNFNNHNNNEHFHAPNLEPLISASTTPYRRMREREGRERERGAREREERGRERERRGRERERGARGRERE